MGNIKIQINFHMKFAYLALIGSAAAAAEKSSDKKCAKAGDCTGETACAFLSFDAIALPDPCDATCVAIAEAWADGLKADKAAIEKAILPKGEGSQTKETWAAGMKLFTAAATKHATCEPKKNCNTDGK